MAYLDQTGLEHLWAQILSKSGVSSSETWTFTLSDGTTVIKNVDSSTAEAEETFFTLTWNLTNCSVSPQNSNISSTNGLTVTVTPNSLFGVTDSNITVTGATKSYNSSTNELTLSNVTGNVTVTITAGRTAYEVEWSGNVNYSSFPTSVPVNGSISVDVTPLDGYSLDYQGGDYPFSVSGCTYAWNEASSKLTLSNSTSNVVVAFYTTDDSSVCLMAGTQIAMADGTTKNIEDIQPGDEIQSYNPVTKELTPAFALKCTQTGVASMFKVYTFDDGNFLTVYSRHSVYTENYGRPANIENITRDWTLRNIDGETTKLQTIEDYPIRSGVKRRYSLLTSNNMYFANGILIAFSPHIKATRVKGYAIRTSPEALNTWKQEVVEYDKQTSFRIKPEYNKEVAPFRKLYADAKAIVDKDKARLSELDYKNCKYVEGKLTEEEWVQVCEEKESLRAEINEYQPIMDTNRREMIKIANKYKDTNLSLKEMFEYCCTLDNGLYDTLKAFYKSK